MAKVKLRIGENEVEVDSRDFYVDNKTLGEVIASIKQQMNENGAKIVYGRIETPKSEQNDVLDSLNSLEDAEVHEPEFTEPISISGNEITNKLKILSKDSFFVSPRTVSETVSQLREYGWIASPLDVSKALTNMAFNKELAKKSQEKRNYYSTNKSIIVN